MIKRLKRAYRKIVIKLNTAFAKPVKSTSEQDQSQESNKTTNALVVITISLLLILILITAGNRLQARANRAALAREEYEALQTQLDEVVTINSTLEEENLRLSAEYDESRNFMLNALERQDSPEAEQLIKEYEFALAMAGMFNYEGSGIRVTLDDKEGINYDSTTSASEIVHDGDVRYIVNYFKQYYVNAINVNTERISAMSPLLCTGPSILVNRVYHSAPYVFEMGIKDTEQLDQLIENFTNDETIQSLIGRGLQLKIEIVEELSLRGIQDEIYVNAQVAKLGGSYED